MKNSLLLTLLCAGISIAHAGGSTKGTGGFNTSSLNGATPGNEQSADAPATATTHRYSAIVLGSGRDAQLISGGLSKGGGGFNTSRLSGRRDTRQAAQPNSIGTQP